VTGRHSFVKNLVIIATVVLIAGCSQTSDKNIAQVGDWTLDAETFKQIVVRRIGSEEAVAEEPIENIENIATELLERQLKIQDGRNKGFDNDPTVVVAYEEALKKGAITELYIREVLEKLVPEEDKLNFYKIDTEEIHAQHIMVAVEAEGPQDARDKIYQAYEELNSSEITFNELAVKYNEDQTTKNQSTPDGDLGWFRYGVMVNAFQDVAFSLDIGEVSEPILTPYGWHIIKLLERRKVENRPTYEEDRDRIRDAIASQRRDQLLSSATTMIDDFNAERDLTFNEDNILNVFNILSQHLATRDPFALLTEEQQHIVLATLDGGTTEITIANCRDYISRRTGMTGGKIETEEILHKLIEGFLAETIILPEKAIALGMDKAENVEKDARVTADNKIYQLIYKAMILDKAEPTEEEAMAYHAEYGTKYSTEVQYTLVEALVSSKDLAEDIVTRVKAGDSLRELAKEYSVRLTAKNKNGVLGPIRKGQYGAIGRFASEAELGEIVGPVRHAKNWSVFKVISKEEPQLREYEKVKAKVKNDIREENRKRLTQEWVDEIKSTIDYKVNLKNVKYAIK
jgi:foldase protein PrsA